MARYTFVNFTKLDIIIILLDLQALEEHGRHIGGNS